MRILALTHALCSHTRIQVGDGLLGSKPVVAVSCGQAHTLALAEGGDLWVWGGGEHGVLG
ncbi:MAG: hypothetical protein ACPIOQ_46385, partial [Promethearchaeia archaeon]